MVSVLKKIQQQKCHKSLKTAINQLRSDTEESLRILTGQSVEVWNLVNQIFTEKQQQRH
jgi:hypothetical protein